MTVSKRVWQLANYIVHNYDAGDMALISSKPPKTNYSRNLARPSTRKGGSPPLDYAATEALVDLKAELSRGKDGCDPKQLASLTYYLRGVLGV